MCPVFENKEQASWLVQSLDLGDYILGMVIPK